MSLSVLLACGPKEEGNAGGEKEPAKETAMVAVNETLNLGVEGMVCSVGCAKAIEETVGEMTGVASCVVSFKDGTAEIRFDNNMVTSNDIVSAISEMNDGQYKVKNLAEMENVQDTESEETEASDDATAEVAQVHTNLAPSFSIPQIVTYLVNIF